MRLGSKQKMFTRMISELILWAYDQGYEMTEGDAYRDPRVFGKSGISDGYGKANSNHKLRLARDLNLFKNGVYLTKTSDHEPIGIKWEEMGVEEGVPTAWGGRFNDGNHYSMEHNGRK